MKNIISKIGQIALLQAVALVGFFTISSASMAEMPPQPKSMWEQTTDDATIAKDARHDPNTYCVNCHGRFSKFEHAGKHFHSDTISPNNSKPLTCVSCHGNISENHRKGVNDVMRFNAYGQAKNKALERPLTEQNQVCFACHQPDKLREAFWAHDTHATKTACTNCHKLHPEKEPMKAIEPKQRVKLCVDCHGAMHHSKVNKLEKAKDKK